MKKTTSLKVLFATLAMCLPIYTSMGHTIIHQGGDCDDVYDLSDADNADNGSIVERNLDLKVFKAIQNNYSAKICYTPSSKYSVKVSGSEKAIDIMDFSVNNGTLCINIKGQYKRKNIKIQKGITLYISAPELKSVTNRGSLTLQGEHWKLNDLSIDNAGAIKLSILSIKCNQLNIENRGSLNYVNGEVEANSVNLSSRGATTFKLNFSVKETFQLVNRGSCKFEGKVKANSYIESCSGATNDQIEIASENLELNVSGAGKINSTFKGKTVNIHGSGACNVHMNVDCDKLSVESSGCANITVKGTADNTKIESHGVAKVDASQLNKF